MVSVSNFAGLFWSIQSLISYCFYDSLRMQHCVDFLLLLFSPLIATSVFFNHDNYDYLCDVCTHGYSYRASHLGFWKRVDCFRRTTKLCFRPCWFVYLLLATLRKTKRVSGFSHEHSGTFLFHTWLDGFRFLNSGTVQVFTFGVLLWYDFLIAHLPWWLCAWNFFYHFFILNWDTLFGSSRVRGVNSRRCSAHYS